MAKKKKPESETFEQAKEREIFEQISNMADRSEKTAWNRKMDNMVKLITKLQPVEEKILKIIHEEKIPIQDEIQNLRAIMVNECIHPFEYLVSKDGIVYCKFCEKKMSVISNGNKKS